MQMPAKQTEYFHTMDSPVGQLSLTASEAGLTGIYFEGHRHFQGLQNHIAGSDLPVLRLAERQLEEYFRAERRCFTIPLDMRRGTAFQQQVWSALARLTYGETTSYAALAASIGNPQAVRAVGAANGRNPFSVVVPCHRVIASDGRLTGYAGGLRNKAFLLNLEAGKQQYFAE